MNIIRTKSNTIFKGVRVLKGMGKEELLGKEKQRQGKIVKGTIGGSK